MRSVYGLIYKNLYLSPFLPQIRKFALQPLETSNGYNSGTVKDRCNMFAPKRGFWGSGNLAASLKFTRVDPYCHGNQLIVLEHKVGSNSACLRGLTEIFEPRQELFLDD